MSTTLIFLSDPRYVLVIRPNFYSLGGKLSSLSTTKSLTLTFSRRATSQIQMEAFVSAIMMSNIASKRSRATAEQLSQMVDFMLENPGLAGGKFQKLHGKVECDRKWSELSGILNSLGEAVKTVEQWHTVWRDLKSRTTIKIREKKKQQAMTGNRPINQEPITELEKRVITIIGNDYIEGHESVAENLPMEEELQLRLENGEEDVIELAFGSSSPELRSDTPKSNKKTPRKSLKRKRMGDVDEKEKFLEIASKQADALKMLAESSAAHVEVAKQQADALKMLAEVRAASVEANKVMADAIKAMGEGLKVTAEAFTNLTNAIYRI
ncbi:uncharacterized protein LOC119604571 [Lucilia sericata]|uniref:uncharacterized protein LOC119604571 n=1 Tax=Lucilia sericata TaxID=13632 RepID=UPI0018A85954|nr:uncharacterized protein LOC119604571 [Lucilia sericata]